LGWGSRENAAGFDSVKGAGFGDGIEDLGSCQRVGWEVVDGFVVVLALTWLG
jgi:hypothetical protein